MAVTIRDVAKAAGTSPSTVSKVMNDAYDISPETAKRVRKVIEELNYRPNVRARNFAKQSSKIILFLTKLQHGIGFSNPHMFEILAGAEEALRIKGYALQIKNVTAEQACTCVKEAVLTQSADGVIIHASVVSRELDRLIVESNFPHTVIGVPEFDNHFCWIDSNNRLAGQMAARHLLQKGYKHIAFIGGTKEDEISQHRLHGLLSVLNDFKIVPENELFKRGDSTCNSGYLLTKELLTLTKRPDAIICANNYIAYGCSQALHKRRIKIPQEIAVITFDDFPFSQVLSPALSVVNIDVYDIGEQAGKLILTKLKKPNLCVQSYTTLPTLIERDST